MRTKPPAIAWLAIALAAVAIAGCGGEREEDKVRKVVDSFVAAGNERDAGAACELLAAEQIEAVERLAGGGSCETALGQILAAAGSENTEVTVEAVRVEGDRATVDATVSGAGTADQAQSLLLVRENGEWKLASGGL